MRQYKKHAKQQPGGTHTGRHTAHTVRLGVNLDHVATVRQARGTSYPDITQAIRTVESAGADGITLHLREDRRHIQDDDIIRARDTVTSALNMEMAGTNEMIAIASEVKPDFCCIVPERREELTTEGGLAVKGNETRLADLCDRLTGCGIVVSFFIEPDNEVITLSKSAGATAVELHTGSYANVTGDERKHELRRLEQAAQHAHRLGLRVNAGHGLCLDNVGAVAALPHVYELNIGHALVADALFTGLGEATRAFKQAMQRSGHDRDG